MENKARRHVASRKINHVKGEHFDVAFCLISPLNAKRVRLKNIYATSLANATMKSSRLRYAS